MNQTLAQQARWSVGREGEFWVVKDELGISIIWQTKLGQLTNLVYRVNQILHAQRTPCCDGLREIAISLLEYIEHCPGCGEKEPNPEKSVTCDCGLTQVIIEVEEALAHPCSCQRTERKEGDAPCAKFKKGKTENSASSGEPDSSSLPVAETPASAGLSADPAVAMLNEIAIRAKLARITASVGGEEWTIADVVGLTHDIETKLSLHETLRIRDAHNAALHRQFAPTVEAWRDLDKREEPQAGDRKVQLGGGDYEWRWQRRVSTPKEEKHE